MAARIKSILFSKEAKAGIALLISAKCANDMYIVKRKVYCDETNKKGLKNQKVIVVGGGSAGSTFYL